MTPGGLRPTARAAALASPTLRRHAERLRAAGMSKKAIGQIMGITDAAVQQVLPRDRQPYVTDEQLQELARQGLNYSDMAKALGVTRSAIAKRMGPSQRHKMDPALRTKITIRMKRDTYEWWRTQALTHGFKAVTGPTPGDGSVGALMDAVADGTVAL